MSTRSRLVMLGAAGLLLAALPVWAKKTPKAPVEIAVIENTGSTNTAGYMIYVMSNGIAHVGVLPLATPGYSTAIGSVKRSVPLPQAQSRKLFQDLNVAMPLSSLPVRHGMRSASFGTQTYITYKGQRSPDLTFASDPRTAALKADIDSITKALHIGNAPRRPIVVVPCGPIVIHSDR